MSPGLPKSTLLQLARNSMARGAEYILWAEHEPRNSDRYLGYARTSVSDARWYIDRAGRPEAAEPELERIAA